MAGRFGPRTLAVALCCIAYAAGCDREETHSYDLVEALPLAEIGAETPVIDVGAAAARPRLVSGWGHDERSGEVTFAWGLGAESRLRWFVSRPADTVLAMRCWSFAPDAAQAVTVIVNGHEAGRIEVSATGASYELPLGRALLVAGWNDLLLRYRTQRPPGGGEARPLAVAWDSFELGDQRASVELPHVAQRAAQPALVLPAGTQVDYFLRVRAATRLQVDRITRRDGAEVTPAEADLEIEVQAAGAPARIVAPTVDAGATALSLALPVPSEAVTRVSLRLPRGAAELVLVRPRLLSERSLGLSAPAPPAVREERGGHCPNVILYLVDTLRADHLGCYGYARDTSPHLDRFAADAVLFTRPVAQSSWTRASVASIFTGLLPQRHGANRRRDALSNEVETLAERMHEHGYETAALAANIVIAAELGFGQGFDTFEMRYDGVHPTPSDDLTARAVAWLKERRGKRPFFLYLHTIDPHSPYDPPEPDRSRFAAGVADPEIGSNAQLDELRTHGFVPSDRLRRQLIDLYDAEVAFNDASFGALLEQLRALGLYDDTLLVFVSDHGEEFFDHGWWEHGVTLYDEQLRVPLLIKFPQQRFAGRKVDQPARHVDLLPTILAASGLPPPQGIDGLCLLQQLGGPHREPPPAISYLDLDGRKVESISLGGRKLIRSLAESFVVSPSPVELFDLEADPAERHNLAPADPVTVGYLGALLHAAIADGRPAFRAQARELSEEVKERLRALGYPL